MNLGKIIKYGHEARHLVFKGIEELSKAVTVTLGPKGKTVIIDNGTNHPILTKDGVTVARAISFTDKWKNLGAILIKEAANRTNQIAGDGTTTATLLTYELVKAGMELANLGFDRIEIKNGFQLARKEICEQLKEYCVKLSSSQNILNIATISANNDEEIGKIIQEAFEGIGDDGIVSILDSYATSGQTVVKFSSGFEFDKGYTSSIFANTKEDTYEVESPKILLYNGKLDDPKIIMPVLDIASKQDWDLVIIAPEYDNEFHSVICDNVDKKNLKCCLIRAPGYTKASVTDKLEDLSILLDCKVWDKTNIDNFNPNINFGSCDILKVTNIKTQITKETVDEEKIQQRCEEIKNILKKENDVEFALTELEVQSLKERLAKLTGGVATIYIGATSAIELKEKKDRYEDAVNAVRAAISDGIISGGGIALAKAANDLLIQNKILHDNSEVNKAYKTFLEVCMKPAEIIIASDEEKQAPIILSSILADGNKYSGYNAKKSKIENNMIDSGIIDPIKVVTTALLYSTSVASTILTSDCVIVSDTQNISMDPNDAIMDMTYEE
jgi:chaperonin GroEL